MKVLGTFVFMFFWGCLLAQNNTGINDGNKAIDFSLKTIDGNRIKLSELNKKGPVVLLVLRGWPEYQCPLCTRQVGEFVSYEKDYKKHNAKVLMVYPGPSKVLQEKAKEFSGDFNFPDNYYFVLDPNYSMINQYGLRWEAPKETAYPSTFVIDESGKIQFSKISKTHGGRSSAEEVLTILEKL